MPYKQLESKDDLALYLDDLIEGCNKMIAKTGVHGQTSTSLISIILKFIDTGDLFLLVKDDDGFEGFMLANLINDATPWVEFLALWTKPGVGVALREEAFEFLKTWAISKGAHRIVTYITRSPDTFFKMFHEPLGFHKIGYILEVNL